MSIATADYKSGPALGRRPGLLMRLLVPHAGVIAFVLLFALAAYVTTIVVERPRNYGMGEILFALYLVMTPVFFGLLVVGAFVRMAFVEKPEKPLQHFARKIGRFVFDRDRMAGAAILSLFVPLYMICFSLMRDALPSINPFSWDVAFQQWDRLLFFGHDGWQLTFALFGTPLATSIINAAYHLWLFLIYMFLLCVVFRATSRQLQLTALYAFLFTWTFGGVVLATVFSSAGPVYFARLGLGGDFEPQMALLRQFNEISPVWALRVQEILWSGYVGNDADIRGITAMPSMHVASSVLMAMLAFRVHRLFGYVMTAFAAVIMIGSVHLAWHYAVDGLLGAVVALASWYAAERVAQFDLGLQRRLLGA